MNAPLQQGLNNSRTANSNTKPQRVSRVLFKCIICLTDTENDQSSYVTKYCSHRSCNHCLRLYLENELKNKRYSDNMETVACPDFDCFQYLIVEDMLAHLYKKEEADKLRILVISNTQIENRVICPTRDCNAVFGVDLELTKQCTLIECPECNRALCSACQSIWHPGQVKINDDKQELLKVLELAFDKQWCRCPQCQNVVERIDGCNNMVCRCGTRFCYQCGGRSYGSCRCATAGVNIIDVRRRMFAPTTNKR